MEFSAPISREVSLAREQKLSFEERIRFTIRETGMHEAMANALEGDADELEPGDECLTILYVHQLRGVARSRIKALSGIATTRMQYMDNALARVGVQLLDDGTLVDLWASS